MLQFTSIALSLFALAVSILTYLRGRQRTLLQNEQLAAVRLLGARAVVLFSRTLTFTYAQVTKAPVDRYQKISARTDARRLSDQLDFAIGLGLLERLITDHDDALVAYEAFSGALLAQAELDADSPTEEWTKMHLIMGLVRLLDVIFEWEPAIIPPAIKRELMGPVTKWREDSWNYLRESQ